MRDIGHAVEVGLLLGTVFIMGYAVGAGVIGVPFVFVPTRAFKGGAIEKAAAWLRSTRVAGVAHAC